MLNALGMSGMQGAVEEALMNAIERAIAALGAGTAIALALGGLVLVTEALARRPWGQKRESCRPTPRQHLRNYN